MEITAIHRDWSKAVADELLCPDGSLCSYLIHLLSPAKCSLNGTEYSMPRGGVLLLSDSNIVCSLSNSSGIHYDMIRFQGDLRRELEPFGLEPNHLYLVNGYEEISGLISRLDTEYSVRDSHWRSCTQAILNELWITIYRLAFERNEDMQTRTLSEQLCAVRAEMMRFPEKCWTGDMIARQANISVSSMYTHYRQLFSISPAQDIIHMRIEKSKRLLQQGHSVAEVAELVGYNNVYHYIRQFYRVVGMTPGKWRK